MIVPFTSIVWAAHYSGKYGQSVVDVFGDYSDTGSLGATRLLRVTKGRRFAFFHNVEGNLFHHPDDLLPGGRASLWWPKGIAARKVVTQRIVDQLWAGKATLDFAVFDIESSFSGWNLGNDDLSAIHADPRYAALAASGDFPADCRSMSEAERMLFNYGCARLSSVAMQAAIIAPLYSRYPNLSYSNFGDAPITKADAPLVPDLNGHAGYYPASTAPFYSPAIYGYVGQLGQRDSRFRQPWYVVAWQVNMVRAVYRAKPSAKVLPWVAARANSNVLDADSWQEMIFHVCCLCGPQVLFFNADDPSILANWRLDHAVSQYAGQAGGKLWKTTLVTALTNYDTATYIVSAARLVDNSIVGRVTFKPGVNTASVTLGGKSVTVKRTTGSMGAWFRFA